LCWLLVSKFSERNTLENRFPEHDGVCKKVNRFNCMSRRQNMGQHHRTVEKYMANRNQNWVVFRDRWEGLRLLKDGIKNKLNITLVKYTVSVKRL
jgi:hypothetical protein